ncbi:efflux RND transporter permease subunit [Abyssibacter profundi]|uniref:AcrB/AcrD/AcrF family protein n=1 Tax=Abyssibacter profundi TaxID=2182787 RepID=A0A363UKD2_9GAMM|nr:efflux RND transporter permease subunit [Abyssibacter profundi]PWN55889.1 AcrB/AcrD/AcrF family protein [Abyssibacter profundi]
MSLTELSLRRPVTVTMVFVCLAVIGTLSSRLLPLEFLPEMEFPGIYVELPYRNSTPEEVERLIVRPVEEALSTLSGVKRMNSESREDGGGVFVQFDWGADLRIKGVEARDKIDAIRDSLPDELQRIRFQKFNASDQPILVLRVSANRDLADAYDMLNRNLRRRVERIQGVSRVELYGVWAKEVRIELSADRVATHQVDLRQVAEHLRAANFEFTAGEIAERRRRFTVKPNARFNSLEEIEQLVVGERGLRLGDIAEVRYTDPVRTRGRHLDGKYAIGLNIFKENGANLVEVADAVLAEIDVISGLREMQGITLYAMDNQAAGVKDSLNELLMSGLVGALLSILVLYAFLRDWPMTLIVALSVPFSILITLGSMYFLGFTLNILSMMGLMLSIGMLVDNAVVVTESVFTNRERFPNDPQRATIAGVDAVALAVTAGTLTTAIVFLPNIFGKKDEMSMFMSHVAITICISLAASLAIARTLIPQLASRIQGRVNQGGRIMQAILRRYPRMIAWTLRHRWVAIVTALGVGVSVIPLFASGLVKADMFPRNDTERLFLPYHVNGVYALDKVEAAVDEIEAYLFANKEAFEFDSVYSFYDLGRAESTIILKDAEARTQSVEELKNAIMAGLPKIAIGNPTFNEQRSGGEQLSLFITGESTERLNEVAEGVARLLEGVSGIRDARVEADASSWEVRVRVDRDRARKVGLTSQQVAESVATAIRGVELRPYRAATGEIDLLLQFRRADRLNLDQLRLLPIRTADGSSVVLGQIAELSIGDVPATIRRQDRRTGLRVNLFTQDDVTPDELRERMTPLMDQYRMPPGYDWRYGRAFNQQDENMGSMVTNLLLALILIYLVMAAMFESILAPFAIITGIGFSFIGVFWFFALTGTTFQFMAMIGMLILMGVVVNNGIVLIDHIRNLRVGGMPRDEAIATGARDRLRPILMTVGTTVLGLIPLSVGTASVGGDGPPYFPMARAIIGGLTFSTVVSLLFLPAIYSLLDDFGLWLRRLSRGARGERVTGFAARQR